MGKALEWLSPDGCRTVAESIIPRIDDRKSTDAEIWAPCPFHQEEEASFSYNPGKDSFSCFGCDARGDLISLYGHLNGLDASTAFREFRAAHAPGVQLKRRPALRTPHLPALPVPARSPFARHTGRNISPIRSSANRTSWSTRCPR